MADISARGLWRWGKGLEGKTALLEKIAFPKIKELPCGLTLVNYSDEKIHQNTPYYHLYHGNEAVGVIAVNGPDFNLKEGQHGLPFFACGSRI